MITLGIRTDNPEAELCVLDSKGAVLRQDKWQAHRELAETLHLHIKKILENSKFKFEDIDRIIVYEGPGSFTGLRIGISVANAIAYSLGVPVIGSTGDNWLDVAKKDDKFQKGTYVTPKYGHEVHITLPKK